MIGGRAARNHPTDLRELAVGDVVQNLGLRNYDAPGPVRAGAGECATYGLWPADVLNGIGRGPDRAGGGRVISPGHGLGVEQVAQRLMLKTRVPGRLGALAASSIDHGYGRFWRGNATGGLAGILGGEKRAAGGWC